MGLFPEERQAWIITVPVPCLSIPITSGKHCIGAGRKWRLMQKNTAWDIKKDLEKGTQWTFWAKDFDGMIYKTMIRQLISK